MTPPAEPAAARVAEVDPDQCLACGQCWEICQARAPEPGDETYIINQARCLGCGLCLEACPTAAISLVQRGGDASLALVGEPGEALPGKKSAPADNLRPGA